MYHAWRNEFCIVFARETQTERPLGRHMYRSVGNIRTGLQEAGWQTWPGLISVKTRTCGLEQVPPKFGIALTVMDRLEQVEIFDFPMPRRGTFVRLQVIKQPQKLHSYLVWPVTAVMYKVTGLTCSFVTV